MLLFEPRDKRCYFFGGVCLWFLGFRAGHLVRFISCEVRPFSVRVSSFRKSRTERTSPINCRKPKLFRQERVIHTSHRIRRQPIKALAIRLGRCLRKTARGCWPGVSENPSTPVAVLLHPGNRRPGSLRRRRNSTQLSQSGAISFLRLEKRGRSSPVQPCRQAWLLLRLTAPGQGAGGHTHVPVCPRSSARGF